MEQFTCRGHVVFVAKSRRGQALATCV